MNKNKKEIKKIQLKIIIISIVAIALLISGFVFFSSGIDIANKKTDEIANENEFNINNGDDTAAIAVKNPEDNNIDNVYIANGEKYDDWEQTVNDYVQGNKDWYQDEDGIVYFDDGSSFIFNELEWVFAKKEEIRYMQIFNENTGKYKDYIAIPLKVKNPTEQDVVLLPTQFYYRGFTPYYCDSAELNVAGSYETYENDLLGYPEIKAGETKGLIAYIPYVGDAKSTKENDIIRDDEWYYQILFRYPSSEYVNATVVYKGAITFPVNENSQKFTKEMGTCRILAGDES